MLLVEYSSVLVRCDGILTVRDISLSAFCNSALIYHTAKVTNLTFLDESNRSAASKSPILANAIRSSNSKPMPWYWRATCIANLRLATTSWLRAAMSPACALFANDCSTSLDKPWVFFNSFTYWRVLLTSVIIAPLLTWIFFAITLSLFILYRISCSRVTLFYNFFFNGFGVGSTMVNTMLTSPTTITVSHRTPTAAAIILQCVGLMLPYVLALRGRFGFFLPLPLLP